MTNEVKFMKNPYLRNAKKSNVSLPIENPIAELKEDEIANVNGGAGERWAEVVLTSLICFGASVYWGNDGVMCTTTVECQKGC